MKTPHLEHLRRQQRPYHRHHPWRSENGVHLVHDLSEPKLLSWWCDVGFVLNRRRVMVWWEHPRLRYHDALIDAARREVGELPGDGSDPLAPGEKHWKKRGRSRKKVVSYSMAPMSAAQRAHFERLENTEARLSAEGIDETVRPQMRVQTLGWGTGVSLCVPMEVLCEADAHAVAKLVRRLLKQETTLAEAFPGYEYGRQAWLAEAGKRLVRAGQQN